MPQYKVGDLIMVKDAGAVFQVVEIYGDMIKAFRGDGTWYVIMRHDDNSIEPYSPIEPYRFRKIIAHDYFLVAMAVIGAISVIVHMALN
jgi:hypothetical protein